MKAFEPTKRRSTWLIWSFVLLPLMGAMLLSFVISHLSEPVDVPLSQLLPTSNGYDDFLRAAMLIKGDATALNGAKIDTLRTFVASNEDVLNQVRAALKKKCSIPDVNTPLYVHALPERQVLLRRVSRLLFADASLARHDGDVEDAAYKYVDVIRFAHSAAQGGTFHDLMVGTFDHSDALGEVRGLIEQLPVDVARLLINELEAVDSQVDSLADFRARQDALQQLKPIWPARVSALYSRAPIGGRRQLFERTFRTMCAELRLLTVHLAIHCFEKEYGHLPDRLRELVPGCLTSVPVDPFSGGILQYRLSGNRYVLYSVGINEVDDGGVRPNDGRADYDSGPDHFLDPAQPLAQNIDQE